MTIGVGDLAPDFGGKDVTSGVPYKLTDFAGQAVLLVFAAPSWCGPCKFEAPVLQDLWEEFEQESCAPKPQFLMVSSYEAPEAFKQAVAAFGLTFPALVDTGNAASLYGVEGVPTVFVIGPDQRVCSIISGASPPAAALYEKLKAAVLACAPCTSETHWGGTVELSRWAAVMTILFGVIQDGGGLGITPGGKPIPIDPRGPMLLSAEKRNLLASLAISELAKSMRDPKAARDIELAAARSAEAAAKKMVAKASRKVEIPQGTFSPTPVRK